MSGFLLHLMRHGEPEQAGRLHGHNDVAPIAAGMALCVERARSLPFSGMGSSDLSRATCPAQAIAAERNLPLIQDARWRELDFGDWEGRDPVDLPADAVARFWQDPDACPPPGGESWSMLRTRVGAAIDAIDSDRLVVTHAGAIRAAIATLFDWDDRTTWAFALPYAAVLTLRVWPGMTPRAQVVALIGDAP